MDAARRVQSELALAGGREGALRGAASNPRILSRIPRMRPLLCFSKCDDGECGGDEG